MSNPPITTDELRVLLEDLYPGIHIARSGLALLAAQLANPENTYASIDPNDKWQAWATLATTDFSLAQSFSRIGEYESHNYTE